MKAILVIDMPSDCDECPLNSNGYCDVLQEYALLNEWVENAPYYSLKEKGSCPLKTMPQKNKYDVEKYATVDYENNITLGHYMNMGWNDCIDEILGAKDETE